MKKPNIDTGARALSTATRAIAALLCVAIAFSVIYWAATTRSNNTNRPQVPQATASPTPRAPDFLKQGSAGTPSFGAATDASHEARLLREAFETSENLADFVQRALAKTTPLSRFYAERAYDHCVAARTIAGGASSTSTPLDRMRAREVSRCDVLLQMFPDTAAFLNAVSYKEAATEAAPSRDRGGSVLGQVDRRSREQRASDLALSMQIDDPNLIAQQMLAMLRADEVSLHGKRLTEQQRAHMVNAVDMIRCERGADCTLLRLAACQERSSACDSSVPMRQVLRDVFGQEDFAEIAELADVLIAAIEARDASRLAR